MCRRVDLSSTPQRALLRAGFVRCGGGTRSPGGGASSLCVGRPGPGALPSPTARLSGRATGAHYPLAVGAGGAGVGTRHQPHSTRSCKLALHAVGAARGRPGWTPLAWAWGFFWGRALSRPRPLVPWGVRLGPLPTGYGCGDAGAGTRHQCHSARSCEVALCAVRTARGHPGGAPLAFVWGVRGRALSKAPTARPLERAAGAHYPLAEGVGAAGAGTRH